MQAIASWFPLRRAELNIFLACGPRFETYFTRFDPNGLKPAVSEALHRGQTALLAGSQVCELKDSLHFGLPGATGWLFFVPTTTPDNSRFERRISGEAPKSFVRDRRKDVTSDLR